MPFSLDFSNIILVYIVPVLLWFMVVSITLRLLVKKQSSTAMLSWLMIIYLVPILGVIAYLLLGEIKLGSRRAKRFNDLKPKYLSWLAQLSKQTVLIRPSQNLQYQGIFDLANNQLGIPCVKGNELHILSTPETIFRSIIQDIEQAKSSINMVFYIWSNAGMIAQISQALVEAKQRGVNVRIILDSVGSHAFFKTADCKKMQQQGIKIVETLHVNLLRMFFGRIDLRQHRKIIVIDNHISYTGSMNMVDPKLFKQNTDLGNWIDIMVRMQGPVSPVLNLLHAWDWEIETNHSLALLAPHQIPCLPTESHNHHSVQIIATGPTFPDDLMPQTLAIALFSAQKSIVITSPYFVPNYHIAEALKIAALRGVEVSLILPKKSDSLMVHWASRVFFEDLLASGVKIYCFEQGLLHTKSVLIDNKLALVGTVNMDMRSFLLNFEVTMVVEDPSFANEIAQLHQDYMSSSSMLDYSQWAKRPLYHRIIEKIFFLFSPLL